MPQHASKNVVDRTEFDHESKWGRGERRGPCSVDPLVKHSLYRRPPKGADRSLRPCRQLAQEIVPIGFHQELICLGNSRRTTQAFIGFVPAAAVDKYC